MAADLNVFFEDNQSDGGHSRRALRSGAASLIARIANAFIQIGSVLCLARLLSPEDYGLVGMVTAVTGFATVLVDLGSRDAIVQRHRISEREVSALFWMTQGVGFACAIAVAAGGPFIARFYGEPRLTLIAVVSSISFITAALTAQPYALLRRAMMFKQIGILEVIANGLAASLAIGTALAGYHYWALVIRPIAAALFLAIGVWWKVRWAPPKPAVTPAVKSMFTFGLNVTGFTMTDFVARSADRVAIGYRLGATILGYYQNAFFVYDNLIDIVVLTLHGVAVAGLSKLRDDHAQLKKSWAKALSMLTFYSSPAFGGLAVVSRDLIVLMLGAKWSNSGVLLSVLALRGIPHTVERTAGWLHVTAGRTDRWMKSGFCLTAAQLIALFIGLRFGPMGVITAYVVSMFIVFTPAIAYAGRPLEIGVGDMWQAIWRQFAGALLSVALAFGLRFSLLAGLPALPRTALLGLFYVASYLVITVGVLGLHAPLRSTISLCEQYLPTRVAQWARTLPPLTVEPLEERT